MKKSEYIVNVYSNGYFVNRVHGDRLTGCIDFNNEPVAALWAGKTLVTTFGSTTGRTESLCVLATEETDSHFITFLEDSVVNNY